MGHSCQAPKAWALRSRNGFQPGDRAFLYARNSGLAIAAAFAAQSAGGTVCVLNRASSSDEVNRAAGLVGPGLLLTDAEHCENWQGPVVRLQDLACHACEMPQSGLTADHQGGSDMVILTTGTTGPPKAVRYKWERLIRQVRSVSGDIQRWALLYPLNHFAGLQVVLHALGNGLSLGVPRSRDFLDVLTCFTACQIEAASATPTFWRFFLGQLQPAQASSLGLRQITLGGEPATADVLDRLRSQFPAARISHVYATTEMGSCFAVTDKRPGFPAAFLDRPTGNVELAIRDGELFVRARWSMEGYLNSGKPQTPNGGWMATGDLVEWSGDRVYFLGRKQEVINVGGVKVYPPEVEDVIRGVPGVAEVRVYGMSSPITGQLVAAELELGEAADAAGTVSAVRQTCKQRLTRYQQPRKFDLVAALQRSNEKLVRR